MTSRPEVEEESLWWQQDTWPLLPGMELTSGTGRAKPNIHTAHREYTFTTGRL